MEKREYYGFKGWSSDKPGDYEAMSRQFETDLGDEPQYVYAVYSTPAYEGSASIVYFKDGKWFEVSGGHCSCYGLEGQWEPREIDPNTHIEALKQGRNELLVSDSEGDYPEATQEHFNDWIIWAVTQTSAERA